MDRIQSVQTPENVIFRYELAGLGTRCLAALVDYIIIALFSVAGWWLTARLVSASVAEPASNMRNWLVALLSLLLFGVQWGYYVFFEMMWSGQSPGKRLLRLRVVRVNGTAIQLEDSIVRNLARIIDYLPLNYFVGFVAIILTRRMQRVGDLVAGTIVVKERQALTLDDLVA